MKKIFTCFAAALMAVSMFAQDAETPAIQKVAALELEEQPGNAAIMWQADATKSAGYVVEFGQIDTETKEQAPIGYIAQRAADCAVPNYDGVFGTTTQIILTYGVTYASLLKAQAGEQQLAPWKTGWENYVNASDLTLKEAYYYVIVEGYDEDLKNVTETKAVNFFKIAAKEQGINDVIDTEKAAKFIDMNGQVRIMRGGKTYNATGARIQ